MMYFIYLYLINDSEILYIFLITLLLTLYTTKVTENKENSSLFQSK